MMKRNKNIASWLGLFLFSFLISLLFGEGMIRLIEGLKPRYSQGKDVIEFNPLFGHLHKPNLKYKWRGRGFTGEVSTNSRGLRDREFGYKKKDGTFRILVLGDSMTEGVHVKGKETYPKVLEELLNRYGERQVFEVINAGVVGWGTDSEMLFFRHEGYKYEPDMVLLAFNPWTDISDNGYKYIHVEEWEEKPRRPFFGLNEQGLLQLYNFPAKNPISTPDHKNLAQNKPTGLLSHIKIFLTKNSRIYILIGNSIPEYMPRLATFFRHLGLMSKGLTEEEINEIEQGNEKRGLKLRNIDYFNIYAEHYTPAFENAWNITKALILQFKREVEKYGTQFVVLSVPSGLPIYQDLWEREEKGMRPWLKQGKWNRSKPHDLLSGFLHEHNMRYYELLPPFLDYSQKEGAKRLALRTDPHFSADGHWLAAQLIYDYLLQNGMIPKT